MWPYLTISLHLIGTNPNGLDRMSCAKEKAADSVRAQCINRQTSLRCLHQTTGAPFIAFKQKHSKSSTVVAPLKASVLRAFSRCTHGIEKPRRNSSTSNCPENLRAWSRPTTGIMECASKEKHPVKILSLRRASKSLAQHCAAFCQCSILRLQYYSIFARTGMLLDLSKGTPDSLTALKDSSAGVHVLFSNDFLPASFQSNKTASSPVSTSCNHPYQTI